MAFVIPSVSLYPKGFHFEAVADRESCINSLWDPGYLPPIFSPSSSENGHQANPVRQRGASCLPLSCAPACLDLLVLNVGSQLLR